MSLTPPTQLFSWKRVTLLFALGLGVVALHTYKSYRTKGTLDGTDIIVAFLSIAVISSIIAFSRWLAQRP